MNRYLAKPRAEKIRAIEGLLNQQELKWERNYKLVQNYIEQYGVLPSKNTKYANVSIGRWLTNQHELVKEDNLAPDRFEKIKELDTFLTKEQKADYIKVDLYKGKVTRDINTLKWDNKCEIAKEFIREFERYPRKIEKYKDNNIGDWFNRNKKEYNQGRLSEERKASFREVLATLPPEKRQNLVVTKI